MMRILTSLLLALILTLTSQSMAVARGGPAPVGQVVICSGGATVVVAVDAEGQPVKTAHICPDATLLVLLDAGEPRLQVSGVLVRLELVGLTHRQQIPSLPRLLPLSRAPPLVI